MSLASIKPHTTLHTALRQAIDQVNALVVGKAEEVELAFTCLLAGGHLLLDDLPGMGKTTLARALAATLGLEFQRVQCTSDLLPSDIVGVSVFEQGGFVLHRGPVFTQVLLADEINRASPRTQSALLEAMAEHQVTIDRTTHRLPDPFFVIATQNPIDLVGTFPLPDAQLDRFLLRLSLGYPSPEAELDLMRQADRQSMIAQATQCLDPTQVQQLRQAADQTHVSEAILRYVQTLVLHSRNHTAVRAGLSPRAGLGLVKAAKAHAFLRHASAVEPQDVQRVFVAVAAHRLMLNATLPDVTTQGICQDLVRAADAL